jgi:taurine dioxygenase
VARAVSRSEFYDVQALRDGLPYGVVVSGLNPLELRNEQLRTDLKNLWTREGLIVFENIDGEENQLELSGIFGRCIVHPARRGGAAESRGLLDLTYEPKDGWLIEVDGEPRGHWLPWHTDLIYVDKLNRGGILRPLALPSRLGQTGFIDKISAYDFLPNDLRERIERLHVLYHFSVDTGRQRFGRCNNVKVLHYSDVMRKMKEREHEFPVTRHPMVFVQEETGRKVLNVSPWFALGIAEMPDEEGDRLLEEVMSYAVDERLAYHHQWKMGQMVLWDNWRMLHSAAGAPADEVRVMQRTTIDGDYGLGCVHGDDVVNPSQYISV